MYEKHFYAMVGEFGVLSAEEEVELFTAYQEFGCEASREKLIKHNLRLAIRIAKKYANNGLDLEDLQQEGFIGLMNAIEKFDVSRGFKFSTYAYYVINQAVKTGLQEKKNLIRLPQYITNNLYKVEKYLEEFPNATKAELAKEFGQTENTISAMLDQIGEITNIDDIEIELDDKTFSKMQQSELSQDLEQAMMTHLNDQEYEVIRARLLCSNKPTPLPIVANQMGIKKDEVRQLEASALKVLGELPELRAYWLEV